MTVFNPLAPLPPVSVETMERQLERYRALGQRVVTQRKLAIFAPPDETELVIQHAQSAARDCFRLACTGWSVLVADTVGVGLHVIEVCRTFQVSYTVVGTGKRPANSASLRYYQHIPCSSRSRTDRATQRDAYMMRQADAMVCIGRPDVYRVAQEMSKQAYMVEVSE